MNTSERCQHDILFGGHVCIKCGVRDGDVIAELRATLSLNALTVKLYEDQRVTLLEQNSVLLAALEDIEQHHYNCGACERIYHNFNLASVKAHE